MVVLISATPGAGGRRILRRTGIASADDTPTVPGRKDACIGTIDVGASVAAASVKAAAEVGKGGCSPGTGDASVAAARLGGASTLEGRRWIVACFAWLSLTN